MQAVPGIDNNTINTYISLLSNKKDTKASSDFLKVSNNIRIIFFYKILI